MLQVTYPKGQKLAVSSPSHFCGSQEVLSGDLGLIRSTANGPRWKYLQGYWGAPFVALGHEHTIVKRSDWAWSIVDRVGGHRISRPSRVLNYFLPARTMALSNDHSVLTTSGTSFTSETTCYSRCRCGMEPASGCIRAPPTRRCLTTLTFLEFSADKLIWGKKGLRENTYRQQPE